MDLEKETQKIFQTYQKEKDGAYAMAMVSAYLGAHYKGINLKVIDMLNHSSLCDYNILISVSNPIQGRALCDELASMGKKLGHPPLSREGEQEGSWILLDLGSVVVHIFEETARGIYDLDDHWKLCPAIEIPQDFYFASNDNESLSKPGQGYF